MKKQVNIGLIGFGVVGSGTLSLLKNHKKEVESRVGARVKIRWICSRHKKKSRLIDKSIKQTKNWRDVINDPEVDCVIELVGGTDPARRIVLSALKAGKHVITANKVILSKYWNEIFNTAIRKKRLVYYEAAVGGGVPVIQALNEGLAGNEVTKITGILNGTTNFVLSRMQETGAKFQEALEEARAAGFAEADPSFDIDGVDTAQKISILGSLATGTWIPPGKVYCEGIRKIQALDFRFVERQLNSTVKLLGIAEKTVRGWVFRVHPTLIHKSHPFANVRNEYNAVILHGNAVGDVMLYGKGAGKYPTSSAVLSDIIFLSRQIANGTAGKLLYVSRRNNRRVVLAPFSQVRTRYYIRLITRDRPGVLSKITGILGRHGISLASVHQDTLEGPAGKRGVPVILLTHMSRESDIQSAVKKIDALPTTVVKAVLMRME